MRWRMWLAPAAGIALVAALVAQTRGAASAPASVAPSAPARPERILAEGRLAAYPGAEVTVAAEVAGIVAGMVFAEKDAVERGDLLAQLRADDVLAALAAAEARIGEASAEIRLAESELERIVSKTRQTVVFITHSIDEAITLADRVVVISFRPGRIKEVVDVDLPRPRFDCDLKILPRYGELHDHIWRLVKDEALQTARGVAR